MSTATWSYDEAANVVFITHPQPIELKTRAEIFAYFEAGMDYCRKHCKGHQVYMLVDYNNLSFNTDELDFYTAEVKRLSDAHVLTIVRYSGSLVQRMAGRMAAIKLHKPSRLYASREEALAVVQGLQRGTISIPPGPKS
jgi:hypothetical protein